ncbi:FkbM family methyltransferase [Roseomonas haemaphysalidis]|uniref:FkbM family methyltransferase n=1 Tax=Roseomonas haemaphysalidis TaxID=2768162 RepID=A0ABS3KN59_9PROT|nr:FkbM family methyltransferase [Roseomonas haemaphysalidis]MBO1078870.1 FkbM family methyltransferase [Roseomonas haemaphysalidis]
MSFISYAQNGEDVILWRALGHIESGFYIDVGACDPDELSVTRAFYERGWSGINVEPSREFFERCVERRPRDINLNMAVTAKPGTIRFLHVPGTGLSTTVPNIAEEAAAQGREVEAREVRGVTMADVCAMAGGADIHFLKIDVEGAEQAVLEGADFTRFRPWIVVVEATLPGTTARSELGWESMLLDAGYDRCLFDGLNLYFLAREHSELAGRLTAGANILDDYTPVVVETLRDQVQATQAWGEGLEAELLKRDRQLADALEAHRAAAEHGATAEAALAAQRTQISELREQIAALNTQVAALEGRLAQAAMDQEAAATQLQAMTAAHEAQVARNGRMRDRLRLEETARDELEQTLKSVEGQVAHQRAECGAVQQRLARLAAASGIEFPHVPGILDESLPERLAAHVAWQRHEVTHWKGSYDELNRQLNALLASRSWRVTAPIRHSRRVLKLRPPALPAPAPPPMPAPSAPHRDAKEMARQVFHQGMRMVLRVPGSREGAQLARRIAPAPVEWLALRFRAYEERAALPPPPPPAMTMEELTQMLAPQQAVPADLSEDEARLYRQFATSGTAAPAAR